MSILGQEKKSHFSKGGVTENNLSKLRGSKQHNEYSINGTPNIPDKPSPSLLDPSQPATKYLNNLPK